MKRKATGIIVTKKWTNWFPRKDLVRVKSGVSFTAVAKVWNAFTDTISHINHLQLTKYSSIRMEWLRFQTPCYWDSIKTTSTSWKNQISNVIFLLKSWISSMTAIFPYLIRKSRMYLLWEPLFWKLVYWKIFRFTAIRSNSPLWIDCQDTLNQWEHYTRRICVNFWRLCWAWWQEADPVLSSSMKKSRLKTLRLILKLKGITKAYFSRQLEQKNNTPSLKLTSFRTKAKCHQNRILTNSKNGVIRQIKDSWYSLLSTCKTGLMDSKSIRIKSIILSQTTIQNLPPSDFLDQVYPNNRIDLHLMLLIRFTSIRQPLEVQCAQFHAPQLKTQSFSPKYTISLNKISTFHMETQTIVFLNHFIVSHKYSLILNKVTTSFNLKPIKEAAWSSMKITVATILFLLPPTIISFPQFQPNHHKSHTNRINNNTALLSHSIKKILNLSFQKIIKTIFLQPKRISKTLSKSIHLRNLLVALIINFKKTSLREKNRDFLPPLLKSYLLLFKKKKKTKRKGYMWH